MILNSSKLVYNQRTKSCDGDVHSFMVMLNCAADCLQGMLEPTKEPVKPVSAAEMIASIAQAPPAAPEKSSCSSDSVQVGDPTPDLL